MNVYGWYCFSSDFQRKWKLYARFDFFLFSPFSPIKKELFPTNGFYSNEDTNFLISNSKINFLISKFFLPPYYLCKTLRA